MSYLNMLGLAQAAGAVVAGEGAVEAALRKSRVRLLLLASDASSNTTKRFRNLARRFQVPLLVIPASKDELGKCIGKGMRAVVGLTRHEFARLIEQGVQHEERAKTL
ncbi:MAG: 50S ribosomal protein L7ae [Firmicutes bacterium]|nr:50S ribosomal protein L7ae [Bacillota bacterium]